MVFTSLARLTRDDADVAPDVFRHGIRSRRTVRVSTAQEITTCAPEVTASRRGRYVAFACDLAVYVHDRRSRTTERLVPSGAGPRISADGRRVAFDAVDALLPGANHAWTEAYLADRATGALARVVAAPGGTQPDGHVRLSDLSGDGRWVAVGASSTLLGFPRVSPWGDVFLSGPW